MGGRGAIINQSKEELRWRPTIAATFSNVNTINQSKRNTSNAKRVAMHEAIATAQVGRSLPDYVVLPVPPIPLHSSMSLAIQLDLIYIEDLITSASSLPLTSYAPFSKCLCTICTL